MKVEFLRIALKFHLFLYNLEHQSNTASLLIETIIPNNNLNIIATI